ncbi:gag-pol polyprotein [Lasius niger]|uniref:Gag-pol polyprotein n=1 Tax=Lasius niger TaxID=67767 RepID=A0A0J7KAX8_LASNI|nr:gag-pol polyprotein [Lasius niger]
MRLRGLEVSAIPKDVTDAIAGKGGCKPEQVRVGEIRFSPAGLGFVWAKCPLNVAIKVAKAKKLRMGWADATVDPLKTHPTQCYRCLAFGHVQVRCTAQVDRSRLCYRCGEPGHLAARCSADKIKCPLCEGEGRPAEHRMGGAECYPLLKGKKKTAPRKRLNVKSGGKAGDPGEPPEGAVSQSLPTQYAPDLRGWRRKEGGGGEERGPASPPC